MIQTNRFRSRTIRTLSLTALALILALVAHATHAADFSGRVVKVTDGDTVQVLHNGRAEKVRLAEIDCPEKNQPYGKAARRFALNMAAQKTVTVRVETTDRYGRTVGEVILPGGASLNRELVREGYAWWYRRYSNDRSLGALEEQARTERRGLWQDPDPVPPWDWRRGKRRGAIQNAPSDPSLKPSRSCGTKRYCRQMTDCAEAKFFLEECGLTRLDGDGDGVPCEALCRK